MAPRQTSQTMVGAPTTLVRGEHSALARRAVVEHLPQGQTKATSTAAP